MDTFGNYTNNASLLKFVEDFFRYYKNRLINVDYKEAMAFLREPPCPDPIGSALNSYEIILSEKAFEMVEKEFKNLALMTPDNKNQN